VDEMLLQNLMAFKEWGVVCAALEQGRQSLILRKGGIHEGRAGFRVQHDEFWLFPTGFHQQAEDVISDALPLLEQVQAEAKANTSDASRIGLNLYAVVSDVYHVTDLATLGRLTGRHLWSEKTVDQRFHYRDPGLFVLVVRIYRRESPIDVEVTSHMSGCKSWVDLPSAISTDMLRPVIDDDAFERQRNEINLLLS
jgi:hypothetical protein